MRIRTRSHRGRIAGPPLPPEPPKQEHPLSTQQQAVVEWVRTGSGNAFVEAVAGSGKTYLLTGAAPHMKGDVAFCVYNKRNAVETKPKLAHLSNVEVATCHSFGYRAWRGVAESGVRVDQYRKQRQMLDECEVPDEFRRAVARMVSVGKQHLVGGERFPVNDTVRWNRIIDHYDILSRVEHISIATLAELVDAEPIERRDAVDRDRMTRWALYCYTKRSIEWSREVGKSLIDFEDMIWLPLVEGVQFPQYDWVLMDEAQDTNPARREMVARMVRPGGRTLWVGDRNQSIFAFTGAGSGAVEQIIKDYKCQLFPLTVTYRCSKAATEFAQRWVPEIEAAEGNAEGAVVHASADQFTHTYVPTLGPGDAILCRLTRPLVSLAFVLIRAGIGCYVEGRDIGKQLVTLATKWKVRNVVDMTMRIEGYRMNETARLLAQENTGGQLQALNDRLDTLLVVAEGCVTVREVVDKIHDLFHDREEGGTRELVVLSTVHKAKGREWQKVFILGWDVYMPSSYAKKDWELRQEANICYVAVTRTKGELVLMAALEEG